MKLLALMLSGLIAAIGLSMSFVTPAAAQAKASRNCSRKAVVQRMDVTNGTAIQFFTTASSGTYLNDRVWFRVFNEDATAGDTIRVSTFAATSDDFGIPINGGTSGNNYQDFDWGPNIPVFIRQSSGQAVKKVTAMACM